MKNNLEKINVQIDDLGFDPKNKNDKNIFKKYFESILIKKMKNLNEYFTKHDIDIILVNSNIEKLKKI